MIWNPAAECASRDEIAAIQLERLQGMVRRIYEHVPFYRETLDREGIQPGDIRTLEDLGRLPFTRKSDLRDHYPFGLFACPQKDIVRIHASSGTTGKPTVVGYTRRDLDTWSEVMARLVSMVGVTDEDVAQIAFGYGLFTGALGLHYALEKVGAMVVPASAGNTEKQIMLMRDFGATTLIATPSYALYIAEVAQRMGLDPAKDLSLKYGLFGGEGSTEEMRREIEERLGILATENYGLSEVIGPGVSGDCWCKCGLHINEDHFIPEIIDPDTGRVLPVGETGELVLTAVTKEALPILRYRTGDITRFITGKCECGRTSMRMAKVMGRSDDMLIIRGVNVFPSQIEGVLVGTKGIGPHYEIIVSKKGYLDVLEVKVELAGEELLESYAELERLSNEIRAKLHTILGLDAKVQLCEPHSLKRFEGKAKRVTDLRK